MRCVANLLPGANVRYLMDFKRREVISLFMYGSLEMERSHASKLGIETRAFCLIFGIVFFFNIRYLHMCFRQCLLF